MKYLVYANETLIGWSLFETGDPPMGCVTGIFYPDEGYLTIASRVREISLLSMTVSIGDEDQNKRIQLKRDDLKLSVRTEAGEVFDSVAGVSLIDLYEELGETGREVSMIGLHYEVFDKHFAHLWERYNQP